MRHRIFLFDDDEAIRKLVVQLLADEGYAVTAAATLEEARAAIRKERVDLALLDVAPYGTGLVGELREHDPQLPIFLFAALNAHQAHDAFESQPHPGGGLILKPFESGDLIATIRGALLDPARG